MLANVANEPASRPGVPVPLSPDALIIGYGNDLRSDDGAGVRVAARLAEQSARSPHAARVVITRLLTPDLVDGIATAAQVVFVDAYAARERDARIRIDRISGDDAYKSYDPPVSGHHADPAELLRLTDRLYGKRPDAWVVGIPAFNFAFGEAMSTDTLRWIDEAVALIGGRAVADAQEGDST